MFVVWLSRKMRKDHDEDRNRDSARKELLQTTWLPKMTFLVSSSLWIVIFCVLYLAYVILFGIALARWDVDRFGYCYRGEGITSPRELHPEADQLYLGITSLYMFALLYRSYIDSHGVPMLFYSSWPESFREKYDSFIGRLALQETQFNDALGLLFAKYIRTLPTLARRYIMNSSPAIHFRTLLVPQNSSTELAFVFLPLGQFLLHLYMVWAIRSANRMHLQGESEDTWGFGQVVALIQILPVLKGCAKDCMGKTAFRNLHVC
jgi:hypothetical protein